MLILVFTHTPMCVSSVQKYFLVRLHVGEHKGLLFEGFNFVSAQEKTWSHGQLIKLGKQSMFD